MSTYNILNEDGILSTILDIAEEIRDTDVEEIFDKATRDSHKLSTTSLVRRTENLICTFPVMVSTSLSIDTAVMIMKAIERKAVVMIQLLFSSYTFTGTDATEILGQFHKNIKIGGKIGLDDFIDVLDRLEESGTLTAKPNTYDQVQAIKEGMRNLYRTYDDFINPTSINEMQISRDKISRDIIVEAYRTRTDRSSNGRNNGRTDSPARQIKDYSEYLKNAANGSDYKKANEVIPTMLTVNIFSQTPDGSQQLVVPIVIGVKARLIPVSSNDIIDHIMVKVEDRNILLQFIRATTRETNFIKDFLLAIDRAKVDALAHSRNGSANPMWKVLERRAIGSRYKRLIGSRNNYMAITTLAISQEDVDIIRKEHDIDCENPNVIAPLFNNYNLMGFAIADEALEVIKFMFDTGEGNWENYSFTSLEREDRDNTYKKVVNLMTKVAR